MSKHYKVYLTGYDPARKIRLIEMLSRQGRHDPARIETMLDRLPAGVASRLDLIHAEKLRHHLEALGAEVQIRMAEEASGSLATAPPPEGERSPNAELPPLGLVTRLRTVFSLSLGSLKVQLGLALFYLLAIFLLLLPSLWFSGMSMPSDVPALPLLDLLSHPLTLAFALVQGLGLFLAFAWWQTALLRLPLRYLAEGRWPPLAGLSREALLRAPDLAASNALMTAAFLLWFALAALPTLLGQGPLWWAGAAALALLGAVVLGPGLILVPAVAANEEIGPIEALTRGWELSRGRRLAILGHLLLLVLLLGAVLFLGEMAFAGLGIGLVKLAPIALLALPPLGLLLILIFQLLALSLTQGLIALFYAEARIRDEGWRPDWLVPLWSDWPGGTERATEPPLGRGWPAWRDLALSLLAAFAAMALFLWLLGEAVMAQIPMALSPSSPSVQVGPASSTEPSAGQPTGNGIRVQVARDTFFAGDNPKLWLRVRLSGVRGLPTNLIPDDLAILRVTSVQGPDGREHYDPDNRFEQAFFTQVHLHPEKGGYSGIRTVHLRPGTTEADIARIQTHLSLNIPRGIQQVRLQAPGTSVQAGPLKARLLSLEGKKAHIVLEGGQPKLHLLGILGERRDGQGLVGTVSRSWNTTPGRLDEHLAFKVPVAALRVYTVADRIEHERDLVLMDKKQTRLRFDR